MNKIPSMFSKKYKKIWEFYWNKGQLELYSDTYNKKKYLWYEVIKRQTGRILVKKSNGQITKGNKSEKMKITHTELQKEI